MTSVSSMNHDTIGKSIKENQSKTSGDNGDVSELEEEAAVGAAAAEKCHNKASAELFHTTTTTAASSPSIPQALFLDTININQSGSIAAAAATSKKQSLYFYAASSVILALCYFTSPTIATEIATQPLPL